MLDDLGALQRVAEAAVPVLGDLCIIDVVTPEGRIEAAGLAASDPAVVDAIRAQRQRQPLHWDMDVPVVQAMRRNETLAVPDIVHALSHGSPEIRARAELARTLGIGALLTIPMSARGRVVGALTVAMTRSGRAFDDTYRPVAAALASRIGLAVENVELYQQSREAVNARDQIMAIVSHDLRNPLSAVSMCLSGLRDQPPPSPENVDRLVGTAESALDLSFRLIQDLLDVAAIDAGRLSLDRSVQPIDRVIARAVDMLRTKIESAELEITLDVATAPPLMVNIDAERLVQVLANLIGNAVKFTESGAIRVAARRMGDEAWLSVTDTGCGIAENALERVFDRFFHAGQRGRERSTGLGLAITKGIVEAHGGRVWAESHVNDGSTFSVALPLVVPERPPERGLAGQGVGQVPDVHAARTT
jgi:signal transduction histidine kinase